MAPPNDQAPVKRLDINVNLRVLVMHGFQHYAQNMDAKNPGRIIDGPEMTKYWIEDLHTAYKTKAWPHEWMDWTMKERHDWLVQAELQNWSAGIPTSRQDFNLSWYWTQKRDRLNQPDLDIGVGDCSFAVLRDQWKDEMKKGREAREMRELMAAMELDDHHEDDENGITSTAPRELTDDELNEVLAAPVVPREWTDDEICDFLGQPRRRSEMDEDEEMEGMEAEDKDDDSNPEHNAQSQVSLDERDPEFEADLEALLEEGRARSLAAVSQPRKMRGIKKYKKKAGRSAGAGGEAGGVVEGAEASRANGSMEMEDTEMQM